MTLCKRGSAICRVTPSTLPVCVTVTTTTTTTTLLSPVGECLGTHGCDLAPSGITSTIASADALRARLIGLWYDCKQSTGSAAFGSEAAGLEFTSDGNWYFLRSDNGMLVRETGFGQAGTYAIIDNSPVIGPGHFQLNLDLNTGSTYFVQWTLAAEPQMLLINNTGVQTALYSHMPGAPACTQPTATR